jgi:ABC-type sulfate transport system permease component
MVLVIASAILSLTCSVLVYMAMVWEDYPAAAAIAILGICLTNTVRIAGISRDTGPSKECANE